MTIATLNFSIFAMNDKLSFLISRNLAPHVFSFLLSG